MVNMTSKTNNLNLGVKTIKLGQFLAPIVSEKHNDEIGLIISSELLNSNPFEKPSLFANGKLSSKMTKITTSVLLLANNPMMLRPAIINATQTSPIYFLDDVYAFDVKHDVIHLEYLTYVLSKLEMASSKTLSISDILNISISVPIDIEKQESIFEKAKIEYLQNKVNQLSSEIDVLKDYRKDDFMKKLRLRKH